MSKRIVSCAITGSIHTPTMSPYLPVTPAEIAQNALNAADAGAAVAHIHARNPENGMPSASLELFGEIKDRIQEKNKDLILCFTTGGGAGMTVEERCGVVPAFKPELASMNAGSINWGLFAMAGKVTDFKYEWEPKMIQMTKGYIFNNTFSDMEFMLTTMATNGTKPEFECYDVGHIYNVKFMQEAGWFTGRPYLQFVMGITGALLASPANLIFMKETADKLFGEDGYDWSAFGAGRMEYPICTLNLLLGGNVRVGMEDNLFVSKGIPAKCNADLVEKMVRIMREFDLEAATPSEARELLGIGR